MAVAQQDQKDVRLPDRLVIRLNESHDSMKFTMQGTKERDEWLRTFPWPLPDTHQLVYEWPDPMTLIVSVQKKSAGAESTAPPSPANEYAGLIEDLETTFNEKADPKMENLDSFAAEKGVQFKKLFGREPSRAQKIAMVAVKLTTPQSK